MRYLGGFRQKVMGSTKAIGLNPPGNNNAHRRFNQNPAFISGTLKWKFFSTALQCSVSDLFTFTRLHCQKAHGEWNGLILCGA